MAESTKRISEDESSCVRNYGQQREKPARDEQPLLVTTVSSTEPPRERFLQESHQYKYDLVDPPTDEAICPVCLDLAIEPFLVECCGQHFCQQCLTNVRAKENACPLCWKGDPKAMHNKHFERSVIHKLQVRCSEKENGCQWEGLLGELQRHVTQCQYVKENCPYKCGDGVQRRHLEEHKANLCPQRPFDCGHCEYRGTYREVTEQHWALCVSFPLACPNNCGTDNIPRGQLQVHCDMECPLQVVGCDFSHAGCKVRVVRQALPQHMSDAAQQHMALVSRALLQDKEKEIAQLKQQLREKEEQHKEEVTKIVKEHEDMMEKKDQLHKEEREKNNEQHKQQLAKKDKEHKKEMEKVVKKMSVLEDLMRGQMEKTNTIHSVLRYAQHTIVLTGYQEKRRKDFQWYSPPYYTHLHGYKMCMRVWLAPSDTLLFVNSHLLRGEYDDGLKWPFRGTVVVQLLNQLSDDNHYDYVFNYSRADDSESQRVTSGERSSCKIPSGPRLPLTALESNNSSKKCQYLKNDCLKFKIVVRNL